MKKISFYFVLLFLISLNSYSQILRPGDGVRIAFLDITDDISGDYFIQPDGRLQLPLIGILNTKEKEFPEIRNEIETFYDSLYREPELTVLALFRINILGEVYTPGYYYATELEKITGIFALAGGTTGNADLESVFIVRDDGEEIELDVSAMMEDGNSLGDIGIRSGDQIFVPRSFWADPARFTWIISAIAVIITAVALFVR